MPLERTSTLTVNGISGVDGNYAVPKMSTADLAGRLRRSRDSAGISALRTDRGRRLKTRAFPALPLGVRHEDVSKSGWTAVFHRDEDIAIRAALEPLIAHRLAQVDQKVQPLTYYPDDSVERSGETSLSKSPARSVACACNTPSRAGNSAITPRGSLSAVPVI